MNDTYKRNQSGSTAVEFSLIAIAFLTILFGIMEAGRIFWTQNAIQYAVENASRAALVDSDLSEGEIEAAASDSLSDMMISGEEFDAVISYVDEDGTNFIEIEATYQYTAMITALLPASLSNIELEASTRRPLVWGGE